MDVRPGLHDPIPRFLSGGGEMGALMRAHDWSTSPIGHPDTWPQALRSAVSLILPNKQVMFVAWGPELAFLYNDAYRPVFGKKHPAALGRPFREIWSEVWDEITPLVDTALGGEATWSEDLHLVLERNGYPEDCWFTFSYSPVRDESGEVAGLFCAAAETTERVLADRRLAAERERQRLQFQQAPGFVCILDGPDHVYAFANQAYERLVGRGGLVGKTVREALPDVAGQGFFELLDTVYATGQRFLASHVPVTLVPEPGGVAREYYLDFVYEPVLDEDGRVTGIFTQGHDVTEAHLAGVALVLNERRQAFRIGLDDALRDIADPREVMATAAELLGRKLGADRCGFAEIDEAMEFVTVLRDWTSGTLSSAVGHFRMDDFGRPFMDGMRAGHAVRLDDALTDPKTAGDGVAAAYAALDFRAVMAVPILKGGRWVAAIFVHQALPRVWTDEDEALVLEVAERTWATVGRARAETAQRDDAEFLHSVLASSNDCIKVLDLDANLIFMNTGGQLVMEVDDFGAIQGRHWPGFWQDQGLVEALSAIDAAKAGGSRRFQGVSNTFAGTPKWWDVEVTPVLGPDGKPARLLCVSRDISRQRDAELSLRDLNADLEAQVEARLEDLRGVEAHLRQAQKMEAVGQLTGGIAHDFNNMLTGVIGGLDIIQHRIAAGRYDDLQRFIDLARQSGERAADLTKRLLAFSRRQSLESRSLDVNLLVHGMEELLRRTLGENVNLVLAVADDAWFIQSDPGQVENALLNLAINARDAMPDGGDLTIRTANVTIKADDARHGLDLAQGDYVRISVRDQGVGMSEATVAHAFEPFFTTKPIGQGTGLGLSMLYGFAKQSHGHADIVSAPGKGTTVNLWLPRAARLDALDLAPVPLAAHRPAVGTTVMVIEDEPAVRLLITEVLAELGYVVVEAVNGDTALPILRSDQRIDLLVSDVGLPGMNGRQLADMARALRPGLKVLFVTGYAEQAARRDDFLDDGMALVTKPFTIDTLARQVRLMIKT